MVYLTKTNNEILRITHNGTIDILKFLFALMIVAFHFFHFRAGSLVIFTALFPLGRPLPSGYISVEFFFIVSGFLMAQSADKKRKAELLEGLGSESIHFVLHKFILILPYYIFSIIASVIICKVLIGVNLIPLGINGLDSIWEVLLIQMSGLGVPYMINDPVWYLSAMLILMLILYPILRKYPDMFINVIAPLVAIFFLGFLSKTYGSLIINYSDYKLVYPGILRAIAEISLGCISFGICSKLPDFKRTGKLVLSIAELFCYALVFYLANITYNSRTDFIMLLLLMVGITITFSQQSIWKNLFQNKFCLYLGRLSMALFLCHYCLNRVFLTDALKLSIKPLFAVYLLCCLVLSVICLLTVDAIKHVYKKYRNKKQIV